MRPILLVALLVATAPVRADDLDDSLRLLDALESSPVAVDYDEARLEEIVTDLASRLPVPLRIDWPSLDRIGVEPHDRISFRLEGQDALTVLTGLTLVLGDEIERPVVEAFAGHVVLTSLEATEPMRYTAAYDVRDLLAEAGLADRLREDRPTPDGLIERAPAPVEESPPQPGAPPPAPPETRDELPVVIEIPDDVEARTPPSPGVRLLWLITDHVDPEAWMNFGGSRARISEMDGAVLVTATAMSHRRVRRALAQLRGLRPNQAHLAMRIVEETAGEAPAARRLRPAAGGGAPAGGVTLWRADVPVAFGAEYTTRSRAGEVDVRVRVRPEIDRERGLVRLEVELEAASGGDERSVRTTITLRPPRDAATIELPGPTPDHPTRHLVIELGWLPAARSATMPGFPRRPHR